MLTPAPLAPLLGAGGMPVEVVGVSVVWGGVAVVEVVKTLVSVSVDEDVVGTSVLLSVPGVGVTESGVSGVGVAGTLLSTEELEGGTSGVGVAGGAGGGTSSVEVAGGAGAGTVGVSAEV